MNCSKCNSEHGGEKMPRGWKNIAGELWCAECVSSGWVLKTVTMPVIWPKDESERVSFRNALNLCFRSATALSNWAITEYLRRDHPVCLTEKKMPPMPKVYLFPDATKLAPEMSTVAINAIINNAGAKYRACRFSVRRGDSSLPTFRYPQPYPLPAQSWRPMWMSDTERVPMISVTLCKTRFTLRLKSGPHFRPQHRDFGMLIDGRAQRCEMALYEKGGTLMAKLVIRVPKSAPTGKPDRALCVATDRDSLLVATLNGSEIARYNADHVRRWVREHERRLVRLREDRKAMSRTGELSDPSSFRDKLVAKQNNRMHSLCHMAAAWVVEHANRLRCSSIVFDCREHGFVDSFPWFKLEALIEQKADARSIEFMSVKNENKNKT